MDATAVSRKQGPAIAVIAKAVLLGMLVAMAGTIPRDILFLANLHHLPDVPWAVPLTAMYLWFFWRFLGGSGAPDPAAMGRRRALRANRVGGRAWALALLAGGLSIVALVFALQVTNRFVVLPTQRLPDVSRVPQATVLALLLFGAPVAGIVEEAAFRGYMQGPIERRCGLPVAILVTGTMFAVAHLDFTLALWPYYVVVAAIYGAVTSLTDSILPAVVLHTCGNVYSNLDLWWHGRAEWQAPAVTLGLFSQTGPDAAFIKSTAAFLVFAAASWCAFSMLARSPKQGSGASGAAQTGC